MIKRISVIVFATALVILAISFSLNNKSDTKMPVDTSSQSSSETTQIEELVIGDPNAKATIIEYADYKCPNCAKYFSGVGKKIREEYVDTKKAKIVFRPFPVFAEDGAQALIGSYCANEQGRFTEFHDEAFDYMWQNYFQYGKDEVAIENILTDEVMKKVAEKSKVDYSKYSSCLASKKYEKTYFDTIELAAPDDINGTPSFIINGQKIVGPQSFQVFKVLIDAQL